MAMTRASSAVRFQPGIQEKSKGMEKAVSLPSLFPNGVRASGMDRLGPKKLPSELLFERKEFGVLQYPEALQKPQITGFLDISQYSNYVSSIVPVDQPLFSVSPAVITFTDFEGLQTYEASLTLRNQDNVARRVKVYPPNSPFFDLAPGRGRGRSKKANGGSGGDKVAPGMEVSYVIRFKPDARIDYSHDLVVITEREKFSVPIRASGGSALLDFPDSIDFGGNCVVGHETEFTVLVRNIGDRATKFLLRCNPPFSIAEPDGYLAEGASCQVDVRFKPDRAQAYEGELHLKYGNLEAASMLYGAATNAEVSLSHSLLVIEDTYVGLETQGVVIIRNNSDVPVDFSWRLFQSVEEEESYRLQLQGQLKHEEREEMLFIQQAKGDEESSDESGSDEERLKMRHEAKLSSTLGRKYGNISKAVQEDPMLFHDVTFSIEPLMGKVWSHSQLMCACSFRPKDALVYSCTAYLQCTGQEERAPLVLKGLGIGPKASFSYDELDVNHVFVESAHRYEVQLLNQGDIEVDFRLVPKDTLFGSRFHFEPSSGRIAVGGVCEITVNFKPKDLGPFHEVFDWVLKGSAIGVTLAFKGDSVRPTFEFDVDKINFGIVSYGFLNSRMLTLSNTAEVPMRYTLRILGDEDPPEFEIVPHTGTLLPNCSQRVQVDFISMHEKKYDLTMAVDLEGVGEELHSIPVTAICAAPQVTFEPHGCLSYGDVFIRYPFHQSLYLHNTSNLPAKFEVMAQEDKSRAEFEPDQWTGSVPPCASHVITVTLTAHMPGPVRVPMYVRILGRSVPFPLVLVANSIGPRVIVDPPMLDWGSVRCLEKVVRHVRLTNNSCIDASVRAFMNERKSLWSVHPKIIHLSPQETLQLAVTLKIDEASNASDTLNLIVQESTPLMVQVKGKGTDTPVVTEDNLDHLDFGTLFTTHTEPREIVIKNWGQSARRITWFREKEKGDKKDKAVAAKNEKEGDKPPNIFRVEPENVVMEPKSAYRFTFLAMSQTPGEKVEETLVCSETLDKGGGPGKQIFKPRLTASFVAPQLRLSTNELNFKFFWDRNKPVAPLTETLILENTGPLEVGFRVNLPYPFSVDIEDGSIPPHGCQELQVDFDPGYKSQRISHVVKQTLTVQYDEHPAVNNVTLKGEVVWPNLELDKNKLEFGIILNETQKSMEVKMYNPTALQVAYHWCLAPVGRQADEHGGPKTPAGTQGSGWKAANTSVGGQTASSASGFAGAGGGAVEDVFAGTLGPDGLAGNDKADSGPAEMDVNQIFDILPIFGKIEPGQTQVATFTYYGLRNRTFRANAVCMVDGGPEYEVSLKGSAAECTYRLDKSDLDFQDIPFTELGETYLSLSNSGKVPAAYNFNVQGMSRQNVVEILPSSGIMDAGARLKIKICFRAGIPDQVCETVLLEVAHHEPQKLTVKGNGTFPGIVIGLPRQNHEEHAIQLEMARRRVQNRVLETTQRIDDADGDLSKTQRDVDGVSATMSSTTREGGREPSAKGGAEGDEAAEDEEESPRSAGSEGTQSVATRRTAQAKTTVEDLDLELEVDRHYLCEVLLRTPEKSPENTKSDFNATRTQRMTMRGTARSTGGLKQKKEPPQVTAAYYYCDFGSISLGQTMKRQIGLFNATLEPVFITIDKRTLREQGFLVEPDNLSKLPPRTMTNIIVKATPPSEEEGAATLEWNLPVKGGPNYKIQLTADFVLPDLVLSTESIDFGRLLVGQRKRVTLELKNEKAVPVEWAYPQPRDRNQRILTTNEVVFDLVPASGVLQPGESKLVVACFSPKVAGQVNASIPLRMRDNQKRKIISVTGRGDILRLNIAPSYSYDLGPVMPNAAGFTRDLKLVNPTDYPIEVYSVDFDQEYLEEEGTMREYDGYAANFAEVSVRLPGDGTWKSVKRRVGELQKEKKERERAEAIERGEEVEEEAESPEAAEGEEEEADAEPEDLTKYPYRVPQSDRVNALIVGPPKSGISATARRLSDIDLRKVIRIDDIIEWACTEPRCLHSDWDARKTVASLKAGEQPTVAQVSHLLRLRTQLPDCNAGLIIDGVVSKSLQPAEVTEAVLEAFGSTEKLKVMVVRLPASPVEEGSEVAGEAAPEAADPASTPAVQLMTEYYEALQPAVAKYVEELKTTIPELEASHKEKVDALEAAKAPAADAEAAEAGEGEVDTANLAELEKVVNFAASAVERAKSDLAKCEELAAWTVADAAATFPKEEVVVEEGAPEPEELPPLVQVAQGYAKQFELVQAAVEQYNTKKRNAEEDRLREIDRKRRAKKAAAKEAAKGNRGRAKAAPSTPPGDDPDRPVPGMENWVNPAEFIDLALDPPPFDGMWELCRTNFPLPLIPEKEPLPVPTVCQVISPPADRPERNPLPNFSILTPVPPSEDPAAEGAEATGEEAEPPEEATVDTKTRWIVDPQSEQLLKIHFSAEEVQKYTTTLKFEVAGDIVNPPVVINVSGMCARPGIATDPRLIFTKRRKRRPQDGYATKAFVMDKMVYDFGSLLAGRDASERFPKPKPEPEDLEAGASTSTPEPGKKGAAAPPPPPPAEEEPEEKVEQEMVPVSSFVMRHSESVRITNDSLFPANVTLSLASKDGEAEGVTPGPSPFILDPEQLLLQIGEQAEVKVWCFPPDKGVFEDKFIAQIEHNPEPVIYGLCALGEVPWASLENEEVQFGRLRINVQAQTQPVRIKNDSTLPVRWRLLCRDAQVNAVNPDDQAALAAKAEERAAAAAPETAPPEVPEEFTIDAFDGKLGPGQDVNVRISFRAAMAAKFRFDLGLEVRDEEGFRDWQEAGKLSVYAETFAVNVVVEPDPSEFALDFGTVLVGKSEERTFEVVNQGDYPVKYNLGFARKWLRDLFTIEAPEDELPPSGKHTIKVTCTPSRQFDVPKEREGADREGIKLTLFDTGGETPNTEPVEHRIAPIRVGVTAVYNSWYVTPPRGLNFGPVERGEKTSRQFVLRNIGIFPFDWCLFSPSDPPKYGADLLPTGTGSELAVSPFKVSPTSGKLEPETDVPINVEFEAAGDEDFDSKISLWVYGVQDEDSTALSGTAKKGSASQALSAVAEGNPVIATSTYMLTGQSCVPGINTTDLQTVFEEQFFARTMEDAIAIAGRPDVRVFCEVDRIFNFGPVLAQGGHGGTTSTPASPGGMSSADGEALEMGEGVTERFRLTNPKAIPCTVKVNVEARGDPGAAKDAKAKGGGEDGTVFRIRDEDAEFTIPAHDSHQIEVCFQPPRLANFAADLVATVVGGNDPDTNTLKFELRGDGAVPSISLQGPPLFGDEGGELNMGKLSLGRSHEVSMTLRNDGLLPATARIDWLRSRHFTVTCPASVHLTRGQTQTFQVRFHPHAEGSQVAEFSIRTLGNPYEDVHISLTGEGYSDDVSWDLTDVKPPVISPSDEKTGDAALPPAPDLLHFGEVAIGTETVVKFTLGNSGNQLLRFELPELMPEPFKEQLQVEPRTGFIEPRESTPITLTFKPVEKLEADKIQVVCACFNVVMKETPPAAEEGEGGSSGTGEAGEAGEEATDEPAFDEIEDTRKDVPLMISAVTDDHALADKMPDAARGERTDVKEIKFRPTVMFSSRVFRYIVENNAAIAAPCDWRVIGPQASAFTVVPSCCLIPANGEKEVEIRFSPLEVENFDCMLQRNVTGMPNSEATFSEMFLTGTALRPWCHIELPASDYRSRRQADTPLDPKYRIIEIHSLGTHVKNTKRFYVYNPTAETINFEWMQVLGSGAASGGSDGSEDFRCLSKRGEIRPDKKFEMVFEFVPLSTETRESFWTFVLLGPKVEEHFLVVGSVEEPRVGMDSPAINFGERLIEGLTVEKVQLVNKEIIPFSFEFDPASYKIEGQPQTVAVTPTKGVIGPDTTMDIEVAFKPLEERPFNFNLICNVKRKKEPVVLNVKGIGYKIHASLTVEELGSGRRMLNSGVLELLDFGVLQVQERRSFSLYLRNDSKRNFNFRVFVQTGPGRRQMAVKESKKPPYLDISYRDVAEHHEETPIEITYAPRDVHNLDGTVLQIAIPTGQTEETFQIQLSGGAKRSRLDFSFQSYDFGPCFVSRGGATMAGVPLATSEDLGCETVTLVATNSDDTDCLLSLSSTYQRESWLDVQMDDTMIPAGGSCRIPILFSPGEVKDYAKNVEFVVSEYTRVNVQIRGRGCPLRLELTDIRMQNIDFGVTTGGEAVAKTVRVVNRSLRPVTFQLDDEKGQLSSKAVTWTPSGMTTLRPKDTVDVNLRFQPMYKIPQFRVPLVARCDNGNEVRLLNVSGTCHATEVRLSEHSVFFGDVVYKSRATRLVKLQNFGDLGAKFRFDVPGRVQGVYSISPSEGFVRPQEEISLTLSFHPTLERATEFRKAERANLRKQGKPIGGGGDSKDVSITVRDIRCVLDGHPPLTLEATGRCISEPGEAQLLTFMTEVRKRTQNTFSITNTQDVDWRLQPQVATTEPVGASFWSCPSEVVVPAGKEATVTVDYMPLVMTAEEGSDVPVSPEGTKRSEKHQGTIFIGTPDGKAIMYNLEGTALPPQVDQKLSAEVPCKKQHTQRVPVKNWLQKRQRFDVEVELVNPPPDSPEAQRFRLHAVGTLDLPPGLERDYKFNIYGYQEGTALVNVKFSSQATGEFIVAEVSLRFLEPQSLDNIHLEAACRQQTRRKILVTNPLDQPARFTGSSTNPDICFSHDPLEVPPMSERSIDVLFRPVVEGSGQASVTLQSAELGTYPYTVMWVATPAGRERTLVLKAPLGGSAVEAFKFTHFAKENVTYSAEVQPVEGYKGPISDFQVEPPGTVTATPAGSDGNEVSLGVRFQPSILGESRALLVVTGPKGGEYKALLTGFAMPPQPQGPINVPNGKQGMVDFRNPFDKPTEFKFQIDNPAFTVGQREMKLDPGQKIQVAVNFKSDRVQGGRLIISTAKVSTPWVFFLKGEM